MKNDGVNSKLSFIAGNLTVSGNVADVSLFNRGDFEATITGAATFAKGFSVDANSGVNNIFSLTTGTVDLGSNKALLNSLNSFTLKVTDENNGNLYGNVVVIITISTQNDKVN